MVNNFLLEIFFKISTKEQVWVGYSVVESISREKRWHLQRPLFEQENISLDDLKQLQYHGRVQLRVKKKKKKQLKNAKLEG